MNVTEERMNVSKVNKEDCISSKDAMEALGISRASFFNYLNILRVDRYKFSFDRNIYISRADFERLKNFKETRKI